MIFTLYAIVRLVLQIVAGVRYKITKPLRKVRTPKGNTGGNAPPPKGEEQWNREKVQSIELRGGNGSL